MMVSVILKNIDGTANTLNFTNAKHFAWSDHNNAIYIYGDKRQILGVFNRDSVYGVFDAEELEFRSNRSANAMVCDIIMPYCTLTGKVGDHGYRFVVDRYDINNYTGELTFKAGEKIIAYFNLKNIQGFRIHHKGMVDSDDLAEITTLLEKAIK